jgi:hypothetical protein
MNARNIGVCEFVEDVRSGIGDTELMRKYALSRRQLFDVYERLMEAKRLVPEDLKELAAIWALNVGPGPRTAGDESAAFASGQDFQVNEAGRLSCTPDKRSERIWAQKQLVLKRRVVVSRTTRVWAEWVLLSGEYYVVSYWGHSPHLRRRFISAKKLIYLACITLLFGAALFAGLASVEEIESGLAACWKRLRP